jgi:hypothetical protein
MSLQDLDLTGNETPEEIDALLDQLESDGFELGDDDADDLKTTDTKPLKVDNTGESATLGEGEEESGEGDTPQGVLAKDGKNVIPYDVLEREREEKRLLQEQLNQFQSRESEWQTKERLLELRNKQLEDLGVDPEDLPENFKVTEEQLDTLAEDYPEIGKVIRHLVAKVNNFESTSSQSQPSSNPVADAIAQNSDLSAWHKEGGELWNKAVEIDEQLQSDPQWKNKPLAQRFAEVSKLVKSASNESQANVKQKAKYVEDKLSNSLPNSPSEVGQTNTHTLSAKERLASSDEADIQAMFSGMTESQIEALLSELDT